MHFMSECPAYGNIRLEHFGNREVEIKDMIVQEPVLASFLRKAYTLRDNILEEQPSEIYHVAHRHKLKLTLRKGPKSRKICNVERDGLKIKISGLTSLTA